ncbi:hypothetical protein [Chryseobacterium formosense]|nr:hypothetical protein [Chryseobacterium formosense]
MSRNYKFHNPEGLYFISFAVVGWLDVFTRNDYKEILLESLRFCQKNKGMEIYTKYSSQKLPHHLEEYFSVKLIHKNKTRHHLSQ